MNDESCRFQGEPVDLRHGTSIMAYDARLVRNSGLSLALLWYITRAYLPCMPTCLHPAGVLLDSRVSAVPDILMALSAPSSGSIVCRRGVAVMDSKRTVSQKGAYRWDVSACLLHGAFMTIRLTFSTSTNSERQIEFIPREPWQAFSKPQMRYFSNCRIPLDTIYALRMSPMESFNGKPWNPVAIFQSWILSTIGEMSSGFL